MNLPFTLRTATDPFVAGPEKVSVHQVIVRLLYCFSTYQFAENAIVVVQEDMVKSQSEPSPNIAPSQRIESMVTRLFIKEASESEIISSSAHFGSVFCVCPCISN